MESSLAYTCLTACFFCAVVLFVTDPDIYHFLSTNVETSQPDGIKSLYYTERLSMIRSGNLAILQHGIAKGPMALRPPISQGLPFPDVFDFKRACIPRKGMQVCTLLDDLSTSLGITRYSNNH